MTDIASDHDAALALVIDGYKALQTKDPCHELLKYFRSVQDDGIEWEPKHFTEFSKRFGKGHEYMAPVFANYYVALKKAAEDPLPAA